MSKMSKRTAIIAGVSAVALGLGGVAFAAWFEESAATADSTAADLAPIEVENATIVGTLKPNAKANYVLQLKNPNSDAMKITQITVASPPGITADKPGCPGSDVTFTAGPLPEAPIAAGATATVTLTDAVHMTGSTNACQGAKFTIPLTVKAELV